MIVSMMRFFMAITERRKVHFIHNESVYKVDPQEIVDRIYTNTKAHKAP